MRSDRRFKYPPNIKEIIAGHIADGKSYAQIAPFINAPSGKAVKSLAGRYGLAMPRRTWHTNDLAKYVRNGLSLEEIASRTGAPSLESVKCALKKRGITRYKERKENSKREGLDAVRKYRERLRVAEDLWVHRMDDRMFNKGSEGRGAVT